MSTVTVLSEDILYEQTNEISIKADSRANDNEAFDEEEEVREWNEIKFLLI